MQRHGKRRDFGLGSAAKVSLAVARERARQVRGQVELGLDPVFEKRKALGIPTFRKAAAKGLPRQPKKDNHFAAMPYDKVAAFMTRLRQRQSFSRLALEFLILTAARSGEIRECSWPEIDLEAGLWTIPKDRMKAGREHVVPLTKPALHVLRRCAELRQLDSRLVFPGTGFRRPMSDMTMSKLMKMMEEPYTVHGFRSTFCDWVSEKTSHPGDIAEAALAHAVPNKREAAYRRGNLLEKRRVMMAEWAAYVGKAA